MQITVSVKSNSLSGSNTEISLSQGLSIGQIFHELQDTLGLQDGMRATVDMVERNFDYIPEAGTSVKFLPGTKSRGDK